MRVYQSKNKFIVYDDYVEIIIYNKDKSIKAVGLVDVDDCERCSQHSWNLTSHGYLESRIEGNKIRLHRFVTNALKGLEVDHIQGNKLDNRKSQLRVCTHQQNSYNSKICKNNKSGVTGVCYDKNNKKWRAKIRVDGKEIWLGRYETFEDAVKVRKEAEEKYFKEFQPKGLTV